MKNIFLSVVVVATLVAAGVGGTFAGFVDTEESTDNMIQAGLLDLLVNGKNDPDIGAKIYMSHIIPCISQDFWVDLYSWSECQGAYVYMQFKNVESVEDGAKEHLGTSYVYDGTTELGEPIPDGYRASNDPKGAGVASTEPELIAEEGGGEFGQVLIGANEPALTWQQNLAKRQGLGVDYASGISEHLDVTVTVPLIGTTGNVLGNPDTGDGEGGDPDGFVDAAEQAAWTAAGNRWEIIASLSGKMDTIKEVKNKLGFLVSQTMTFVHVDVHLQQLEDVGCPNPNVKYWPTNALQGDLATWDMLFELKEFVQHDVYKEKIGRMEILLAKDANRKEIVVGLGNGEAAFNSVPTAIYSFLRFDHFEDSVTYAVSLGGDTDTIGAMTGAISGAYYGDGGNSKRMGGEVRRRRER